MVTSPKLTSLSLSSVFLDLGRCDQTGNGGLSWDCYSKLCVGVDFVFD
jgi:hypothetical protein